MMASSDRRWVASKTGGRVIHPRKIGLRLEPLSLILLYEDGIKVRKRSMPIRSLKSTADARSRAEEFKLRHMTYLASVPTVVLTKLISIAQQVLIGLTINEAVEKVTASFTVDKERDLNAVSELELKRQKELMELTFLNNAVSPLDPRFIYDKQITFHRPNGVSDWDEEDDGELVK